MTHKFNLKVSCQSLAAYPAATKTSLKTLKELFIEERFKKKNNGVHGVTLLANCISSQRLYEQTDKRLKKFL